MFLIESLDTAAVYHKYLPTDPLRDGSGEVEHIASRSHGDSAGFDDFVGSCFRFLCRYVAHNYSSTCRGENLATAFADTVAATGDDSDCLPE